MIIIANYLSPSLDDLARRYGEVLAESLGEEVRFEPGATLDEFREGRVGIALVCGLAYSLLHDDDPERFVPIAAPVVGHPQSRGGAVYFSDIVVPVDSSASGVADLAGARFAYNEVLSFSGYRAVEHELSSQGLAWDFFSERIPTGAHHESLEAVAQGRADAAAIDSHVLLLESQRSPALTKPLRVAASLGPYPAPPIAINRIGCDVSESYLYRQIAQVPADCLEKVFIERWQAVDNSAYDAIRAVTRDLPNLSV